MTKTLKPLRKHYEHLDARDRYRLVAQAKERGDDDEIDRLFATCPYEEGTYRIRDRNFVHTYERSQRLCAVFTECFIEALYKIEVLALQLDLYACLDIAAGNPVSKAGLWALSKKDLRPNATADALMEAFKNNSREAGESNAWNTGCGIIQAHIGELKALYGAMHKFCDEAGLEMGDILCWNSNIKGTLTRAKGYLEMPIEVDETFLDALYMGFKSVWTGKPETYPDPYSEEEVGRRWNERKQDTDGYDSIDIYAAKSNNHDQNAS